MLQTVAESFGQRNFAGARLGDRRRTRRLVQVADEIVRHPGGTLPDKLGRPCSLRGFYRLMSCRRVTHEAIITAHAVATHKRIAAVGDAVVLILHDDTALDFTSKPSLHDQLGLIGDGIGRGFFCHSSLAVRADNGETLGLTAQMLYCQTRVPQGESRARRRARADRQSRWWVRGAEQTGPAPADVQCVDVADRAADTFEFLDYEVRERRHFVVRARQDRNLNDQTRLFQQLRAAPAVAQRTLVLLPGPRRIGRTVQLHVSFCRVRVPPPKLKSGEYRDAPLALWAVRVWEYDPPADAAPLEWLLLTNVAVTNAAEACERLDWYSRRMIIEEFHKALKTACQVESMQFTYADRLKPAIALLAVVATTLLQLRDAVRQPNADVRPAEEVVDPVYVEAIRARSKHKATPPLSVRQFYLSVARLGGHQNRKCDGLPGWLTLWRGWMKLELIVTGRLDALPAHPKMG
jgi:transposase-like protein